MNKKIKTVNGKAVIIKYANRKLYYRAMSKYVNLKDILNLGIDNFVVWDNATKTDITNEIALAALVKDYETKPGELLGIIKYGREVVERVRKEIL